MSSLDEVLAASGITDADELGQLRRLVRSWGLLADLCFADLLLFVPVAAGDRGAGASAPRRFAVCAQVRPTTNPTLYMRDLVGDTATVERRPQLADAWEGERRIDGHTYALGTAQAARIQYVPVRLRGRTIAVLTREWAMDAARRPGLLERTYLSVYDRLSEMITLGSFPFAGDDDDDDLADVPRVGDGSIVLDEHQRVVFASPNAVSALHRLGTYLNVEQRTPAELGVGAEVVSRAYRTSLPASAEVDRVGGGPASATTAAGAGAPRAVIALRVIPLTLQGAVSGALVLLRDVTDLRRRDRMLRTKDVQVREVHHRVKNNLQTISALLRLQGRRVSSPEAKHAIEQSVRRVASMALVHETLSRQGADAVPFGQVVRLLVRLVEEGVGAAERRVRIVVEGDAGDLDPAVATPLSVVLTELLQNAAEHGLADAAPAGDLVVTVRLEQGERALRLVVADDGVGFPEPFEPARSASLGLTIVRSLVSELGGAIAFSNSGGAVVEVRIPLGAHKDGAP